MQPAVFGDVVQPGMGLPLVSAADATYCAAWFCEMQLSPPQFELRVMRAARACTETCMVALTPWVASTTVIVT